MFMRVMPVSIVIQQATPIRTHFMKRIFILLVILGGFCPKSFGQKVKSSITGRVSFVTSANVYVKFDSTDNIKIGDSLTIAGAKTPCLLVKNKSSKSLVCSVINGCQVKVGSQVIFVFYIEKELTLVKKDSIKIKTALKVLKKQTDSKDLENISGKLSVTNYNNFYNNRENRQRMITRFSLFANHINNSNFSFESYLNYYKDFRTDYKVISPFKVYNLAGIYNASPNLKITFGRKINNFTSSLGAIDGLQIERKFGRNYVGIITGFRPDIVEYSFNSNLLQYGAYFGRSTTLPNLTSQTTIGFIEQRNSGQVDRRYTYFQHSSTINKSLNLFSSVELDMYDKVNGQSSNNLRLTNLYISARYKFSRKFNASMSFDSRKRIIYYETFQSEVERMLSDDLARQGLRLRVNSKPFKYVNVGGSYSVRFQNDSQNKSENINAYVSMYKIPNIGGSISINYNRNTSNYLESNIVSIRHSRTAFKDKLNTDFYFRFVDYNYTISESQTIQYYFGTDLSLYITRNLRIGVYVEYLKSDLDSSYRINTKIVKRFNNKKKKRHYAN